MKDILIIVAFLAVCASPVLLAVLILKIPFVVRILRAKINTELRTYVGIVSVIIVLPFVLLVLPMVIGPHITTFFPKSRWAYAMQYNTETQYVVIDPQPHDCEFFKAPIGNKYCHFDRTVSTQTGDASVYNKTLVYVSWDKVPD
jgi:hypothetical protein